MSEQSSSLLTRLAGEGVGCSSDQVVVQAKRPHKRLGQGFSRRPSKHVHMKM